MYLHYAFTWLKDALQEEETNTYTQFFKSLSESAFIASIGIGLVIVFGFVAVGLKSRFIASILGLVNIGFVFYQHPFFKYAWREDGEWKYDENMPVPSVTIAPKNNDPNVID